jgi:transposase
LYRELTMMEVREVLRRVGAGQTQRRVARDTGIGRNTVARYVDAAHTLGFTEGEPRNELVAEVTRVVQSRPLPAPSEQRVEITAHREQVKTWLDDGLKLTKVHVLLERQGVSASYATLRRFVMDELGWGMRAPTIRIDDPAPGEEAQVDFGLMGRMYDPETGRTRKLWALIVTLSHSRYGFVYPTFSQDLSEVCAGLDAAWQFFGGVPKRIVPDNMKTVVVGAHATSPRLNDAFTDYAQARGIFVDLARVRSPKDKARVENQVSYVRESWFEGERFTSLDEARRSALAWCRDFAGARVHGTTRRVPREHYEQDERSAMQAPPSEPFDVPHWTDAKVHEDHHIQVQRALYSVPTRFIGSRVRVRSDRSLVRIYLGSELIKTHPRKQPGQRSTDPNDYPPGTADYALRSVDRFVTKAEKLGPNVGVFTERLLDGAMPWRHMRQAHQLERLCKKYGAERVDALCRRSLEFDVIDVPRLERMLKQAFKAESSAEDEGSLRSLPQGRFARAHEAFRTVRKEGA